MAIDLLLARRWIALSSVTRARPALPREPRSALLGHDRCLLPADRRGPLVGEQEAHELLYRGRKALASHVDDAPRPEDGEACHLNHHQAALPAFELDRVSGEHRNP